jgi:SPP1 family phage portal protein
MIRIFDKTNIHEYSLDDYKKLFTQVDSVLSKRQDLHEKYTRGSSDSQTLYDGSSLKVPFEKFIVDLATGYLSGKPDYSVNIPDELDSKIRSDIFEKESLDESLINEMKSILDYITNFNDDSAEVYSLIRDLLLYGACYEVLYENLNNELIYTRLDALNTCSIWDTNTPANLLAIVSKFTDKDKEGKDIELYRVVDKTGHRVYITNGDEEIQQDASASKEHLWNDVPGFAVEIDFSIIENSEAFIAAYENLLENVKNTYQYNDVDCKMKISGYKAQNRLTVKDDKGNTIINPDRIKEDEYVLQSRTFYTEEGGDAEWLIKPVDANGVTTLLKYYVDSIFQLSGIPNTADLAFNSSDLNASAIDRKFYVMDMKTQEILSGLKKGILRRFELIFGRINYKKSTKYDFRYITIDIPKNLPSMTDETIEQMIKLNGILSEETIIEKLGYDYETEKTRKEADLIDDEDDNLDKDGQDGESTEEEDDSSTTNKDSESNEGTEISKEKSNSNKDRKDRSSEI